MRRWDRDEENGRFAFLDYSNRLHVYDYASYVAGGAAMLEQTAVGGKFIDVSFDNSGNLWAAEAKNNLWKFSPSGNGYSSTMYTPYGPGTFEDIKAIHVSAGFIIVAGTAKGSSVFFDVRLLKIESTGPRIVDLDDFFKKYYHEAPVRITRSRAQYAGIQSDVQVVKWGGKTYLMYSVFGLGDVFEIEGSDSISHQSQGKHVWYPEPELEGHRPGRMSATSSRLPRRARIPQVLYDVTWDFGNPESGDNRRTSRSRIWRSRTSTRPCRRTGRRSRRRKP